MVPAAGQGRIQQVLTPELLARLYIEERRPADDIAAEYGTTRLTIYDLAHRYGLQRKAVGPCTAAYPDPDELYRLRHVENASTKEVANAMGIAAGTVWKWMRRYGIPCNPRTKRQAATAPPAVPWTDQKTLTAMWERGWPAQRIAEATGIAADAVRRRLEAAGVLTRRGMENYQAVGEPSDPLSRELLEAMYLVQRLTPYEIAKATGTTHRKVDYRLTRYGIPRRHGGHKLLTDITPEVLQELYVDQQRTSVEIADMLECSSVHVRLLMRSYGIELRTSELRSGSGGRTPLTAQVLRELHVDQGMNARQIAKALDYCSTSGRPSTERIRGALAHHGISIPRAQRTVGDEALRKLYYDEGLDEVGIADRLGWRTPSGKPSLHEVKQRIKEAEIAPRPRRAKPPTALNLEIRGMYEQEGITKRQIAAQLGWYKPDGTPDGGRVAKRLARVGIEPGWRPPSRFACDPQEIRRLYEDDGLSQREIAVSLGWFSPTGNPLTYRVQQVFREADIPSRARGGSPHRAAVPGSE
ncbi:transposase [Catenulispora sp. GP43]|uniref:hypothetical protein n=1 Tax=Catenulispora sp. GP43 TaxID=3156263 RepID=UPI003516F2AA